MIQDQEDFKSKWVPIIGGKREGDLGWDPRATGRIHLSTVFTEIGSDQHTCIMGEVTRNRHIQERGCLCVGRRQAHFPNARGLP